jgi:hypothetical protein
MAHNIKAILKMMLNKVKVLFDTKMEKWWNSSGTMANL